MDFHSDDYNFNSSGQPQIQPRDAMITVAVILSAIAVAASCCVYASLTCGALAIILALLSRGQQKKLSSQGRLAVIISVVAIIVSILVTVSMFVSVVHQYGSLENFIKEYSALMETMTGTPLFPEGSM